MTCMRARWLSRRAVSLHVAVLLFVPACAIAAWWQMSRAQDGNSLSYVYSVMWPVFGILGLVFWWLLIHTDYETVGLKGVQRQQAGAQRPDAGAPEQDEITAAVSPEIWAPTGTASDEDPELAAYNARLAELARTGPKTWRRRETVVVRRPQ
jgi:DNA-binding transcriptional regulator of glucitol operon